jgi:transposase InsO family protein
VIERPSTREREAATLYLTDLNMRKNIDSQTDLLRFNAKVQTSHSKTHSAYTLMDPGASHCYIDSKFAKQLGLPLRPAGRMSVTTAGIKHPPTNRYQVWLKARIRGITGNYADISGWFTLFDLGGVYDLIVGKNWHSTTPHLVDSNNILRLLDSDMSVATDGRPAFVPRLSLMGLRPHQGRYREVQNHCTAVAHAANINLISAKETERAISSAGKPNGDRIFVIDIRQRTPEDNTSEVSNPILADLGKWRAQIRQDFSDLFQPPTGVPPPGDDDFRILTDPSAKVPHRQPYRMTPAEREEFEEQIKKLLANGWITDSHSRYAAPVIFVKKPNGTLRMCVDYRGLNKITVKDRYPLPYIDDLLDKLHGGRIFTKLDLASGYHQVRIHPDDCHKTAFIAPEGFYEYKVIPFGLANAPAAFMRLMHRILRPHRRYAIVYLDDVLIFSKTLAEHKAHVDAVLQSIRRARLRLSDPKCIFGALETSFVGFKVNKYGVHTEEKKVAAVQDWPVPKSPSALRSFLGLAGYYRKFVFKFAHRANLLYDLATKTKDEFHWTPNHQIQFEDLKQALTSAPVLATLDPDTDFILRTDASDTAIGGVLSQKQLLDGKMVERPLGYFSRKLHSVETRYPAYDRELLAISANLEHWACYVHGRRHTTIYTDHAALQHILAQNKLSSRQWRHLDKLQQHDYDIKYFPGASNTVADALSRIAYTQPKNPETTSVLLNVVELRISASKDWLGEVQAGYKEDLIFGPVLEYLDGKELDRPKTKKGRRTRERAKAYLLQDGLLYHKPSGGKLCIPANLRSDVIREAHDAILGGGHAGIEKTVAAVTSRYHWPRMTDTITDWIRGCDVCHRIKHKNAKPYGLLQALPTPLHRAERVNIDFITKLPTSESGYDAVATVIDPLTKRARWIPVTEAKLTAEKFATTFIDGYVRSRGLPVSIVSDRDARFTSNFWQSLCSQLGITLRMSTAYHPQSDGQAEKANATLETFLKAYIAQMENSANWDRLLPLAEFTYNAAKHKAIGMSPFEADIGYIPRLPLDLLAPGSFTPHSHSGIAYAENLANTLRMLRERMEETQLAMVTDANEHRQQHPFQVGDDVFLDTRLLPVGYANVNGVANEAINSRKFQHPYAGPFRLLKKAGNNAFLLDIPARWRLHPVFNVSRLKPSKVDKTRNHPPPPPLRSTLAADTEYEVEAILEHKGTVARDLKYLVKWVGYQDPTWEPLENLKGGSKEILRDYHALNGLRAYQWMKEG